MRGEFEILLVEDNEAARDGLAAILEMDGYRVHVAGRFEDVFGVAARSMIQLVIVDRRLPDGNVEERLPELKRFLPDAEFMVVTGSADLPSTIKTFKLGVTDFLLKPVNPDVIRQTVARIVRQRQTEVDLRRQEHFAKTVLDTAEALIVVLDIEGRVVRFNSHFTHVTGWQLSELEGKDYFTCCIPEDERSELREVFFKTALQKHTSDVRNRVVTKNGCELQIRWSNTALKDDDDDGAVLAVGIDVTEVIEAQDVAKRSQRLAAIGETVAGLAHECRNALHRIQTSAETLQLDLPERSESQEEVDCILRATRQMEETLEEVRHYAAPIHLKREPILLPNVWRRTFEYLTKQEATRDIELIETLRGCDVPVNLDLLRIERVFRNLFENSLAACTDPVRIRIDCRCNGQGEITIDLEDNGPGLSDEQRDKLFEPFYTTKTRGTGLGMSIVQRSIEAHGGSIDVADPKRDGARFVIRLDSPRCSDS